MRKATAEEVDLFHGRATQMSPVTVIETLEANPGTWFVIKASELVDEGENPRLPLRFAVYRKDWELETLEKNTGDHEQWTLLVRRKPGRK